MSFFSVQFYFTRKTAKSPWIFFARERVSLLNSFTQRVGIIRHLNPIQRVKLKAILGILRRGGVGYE